MTARQNDRGVFCVFAVIPNRPLPAPEITTTVAGAVPGRDRGLAEYGGLA